MVERNCVSFSCATACFAPQNTQSCATAGICRPHPTHFSLDEAIEVAQRVGARQTYFTHICHEMDHAATNAALPAGMALAYDGLRVALV